jgi:zinc protease
MLERGTRRHSRLELARELESHGLQLGVEASGSIPTSVICSGQGLAEELPRLATLLFELLRHPVFPSDELGKLRDQLLGALARERQDTFSRAYGAFTRHLYPNRHPHHRRTIDARESELLSLTRDDLAAFHGAVYGPESLVLAVVGDVDADRVCGLMSELVGEWRGEPGDLESPPAVKLTPPAEERVSIPDRPNIDVVLGHRGALLLSDEDFQAASLANSCLGQSTLTSRLGLALRDRAGLTYGVYSRFFGIQHIPGPWATVLSVAPESLEEAVEMCRRVIADYLAEGPGADELTDEQQSLAGAHAVRLATNAGVTRELVTVMSAGLPVSRLDTAAQTLLAVTRDEVVEALHRHIHPDHLVVAAAGSLDDADGS